MDRNMLRCRGCPIEANSLPTKNVRQPYLLIYWIEWGFWRCLRPNVGGAGRFEAAACLEVKARHEEKKET